MNNDMTNEEWFNLFKLLIKTMEDAFKRKHEILASENGQAAKAEKMKRLQGMLGDVTMLLRDHFTRTAIEDVISRTVKDTSGPNGQPDGRLALIITGAEMAFVTETYAAQNIASTADADEGIDASKTVKDSIEKLFKWMPWHKTILDGLNEILSLGRAI